MSIKKNDRALTLGDKVLKVDHAGEHGAVNIYAAQIFLARLTAPALVEELCEFKAHEEQHRALFLAELQRRGVRRCRSYWLCGIGGCLLGIVTGALGRHAVSATTVAVEQVVLSHLKEQLHYLTSTDTAAASVISKIVNEEQHHHDQSASHLIESPVCFSLIRPVVAAATESVIWLGMHM